MYLGPVISALCRNKVGAVLIALQITLTLAILCNALFIVQQKLALMERPSGVDERDVFIIDNDWIGTTDIPARVLADLNALRSIPQVESAYESNMYPFENNGWGLAFSTRADGSGALGGASYFGDEETLATLGLRLIAGRNFNATDVVDWNGLGDEPPVSGVILSRALAERLGHGTTMIGRRVTFNSGRRSTTVVGVVDRLQTGWAAQTPSEEDALGDEFAAVLPYCFTSMQGTYYVLHARRGQLDAAMKAAQDTLLAVSRQRAIDKVQSLADAKHEAERDNRAAIILLTIVSASLLAVTAFGIVGLGTFWVTQRRRQIGIRRALGATRVAIVQHFQVENLLITLVGSSVGVAVAVAANLWMVSSFSMQRLPIGYVAIGAIAMLALGQLAVLWPALRAASVHPAVATRSI